MLQISLCNFSFMLTLTQHVSKFAYIYSQAFHMPQLIFKFKKEILDFAGEKINLLEIYMEILNLALDVDFKKWNQMVWYIGHYQYRFFKSAQGSKKS